MKTILLIENNSAILENLTEALELEGYNILAANNGRKGIEYAREFMPDLIVSAILLGKMDGYAVLRALLNTAKTSRIPFIFSTTKSQKSDRLLGLELGADDYLIKPYGLESLFSAAKKQIICGSQRAVNHISVYS